MKIWNRLVLKSLYKYTFLNLFLFTLLAVIVEYSLKGTQHSNTLSFLHDLSIQIPSFYLILLPFICFVSSYFCLRNCLSQNYLNIGYLFSKSLFILFKPFLYYLVFIIFTWLLIYEVALPPSRNLQIDQSNPDKQGYVIETSEYLFSFQHISFTKQLIEKGQFIKKGSSDHYNWIENIVFMNDKWTIKDHLQHSKNDTFLEHIPKPELLKTILFKEHQLSLLELIETKDHSFILLRLFLITFFILNYIVYIWQQLKKSERALIQSTFIHLFLIYVYFLTSI